MPVSSSMATRSGSDLRFQASPAGARKVKTSAGREPATPASPYRARIGVIADLVPGAPHDGW
ncbi:hypothetical protein [Streptomyces sp. IBSBF 2435]|uniref:hypothetical protein n=1 Tax=Streptomyces sp. IBSBF 2435 TaxID=2903531 RepID=UPI002FDC151A